MLGKSNRLARGRRLLRQFVPHAIGRKIRLSTRALRATLVLILVGFATVRGPGLVGTEP